MIIFYDRETKKIVGTVDGRLHNDDVIEKAYIGDPEKVGKFVVPFEKVGNECLAEEPIREDIKDFEDGKKKVLRHKVKLDKSGKVIGFSMVKSD